MEESQEGNPNKAVDNRKPDGTFGPGNNANPAGRPKGQSLKEFWRQRFQEMTDDEKIIFSNKVGNDTLWKMAEGNPKNDVDLNAKLTMSEVLKAIEHGNNQNSSSGDVNPAEQAIGQALAITESIQDTGQEEKLDIIPPEQSPAALQPTQVVEKYNPEE